MQTTIALLSLAAAAYAAPQAALAPTASAPAGCSSNYPGTFEIQAVNISSVAKRSMEKRATACGGDGTLVINLKDGKLTDAKNRVGEIVANYQFQFDPEPQTGAIYTSGFSACNNGSLALGGSAVFYECLSGGFYNLYDRHWAAQCEPILLNIIPCGAGSGGSAVVGQSTDGQATGTAIGQKTDGQPTGTAVATGAVSQITDGQVQAGTPVPISQITDGQIQVVTAVPIGQISDGQIQATTAASGVVSQISDGQVQATTAASGVVSQISDGQVQATTAASGVVSQISDGQIQATTAATGVVSQISDGQIQATGASNFTSKPTGSSTPIQANSGSSFQIGSQLAAIVLGAVAVALL